jgi:hypothetical protein
LTTLIAEEDIVKNKLFLKFSIQIKLVLLLLSLLSVSEGALSNSLPSEVFGETKVYLPAESQMLSELGATLGLSKPAAKIFYYSSATEIVEEISFERWTSFQKQERARKDYFLKLFYANTRSVSRRGISHIACFDGPAESVVRFFVPDSNDSIDLNPNRLSIKDITVTEVSVSSDNSSLGIAFNFQPTHHEIAVQHHFRMTACGFTGKNAAFPPSLPEGRAPKKSNLDPNLDEDITSLSDARESKNEGFTINDSLSQPVPEGLPRYSIEADYELANLSEKEDRPWKGMDLTTEDGALKFAILLQRYVYEGMANQSTNPNLNFKTDPTLVKKGKQRYWCHMPWLNQGKAGREAIHGLTEERPLFPSPIYKNVPPAREADYGIGFYNAVGCQTISDVFGTRSKPKLEPDFSKAVFSDGTVTHKILFTTWNPGEFANAFKWQANVARPREKSRSIKTVNHLQMDIAVKDSTLIGLGEGTDGWVMLTYYFDDKYSSPIDDLALPLGLKKMRPAGIQTGYGKSESLIFKGAKTNGLEGRLNGPADNSKGSCLGCHGVAGTPIPMVPGILDPSELAPYKEVALDKSQQIALAKKNYETRKR